MSLFRSVYNEIMSVVPVGLKKQTDNYRQKSKLKGGQRSLNKNCKELLYLILHKENNNIGKGLMEKTCFFCIF